MSSTYTAKCTLLLPFQLDAPHKTKVEAHASDLKPNTYGGVLQCSFLSLYCLLVILQPPPTRGRNGREHES